MNNLQDTLLFPVRNADARKQFLFACLVALAGFIIPILPMLILTGYSAKIMRQIIEERSEPSMPDWKESDWSEMLLDGLRIYGARIILMLPVMLIMGIGFMSIMGGSIASSISISEDAQSMAAIGVPFFLMGFAIIMLSSVLLMPYSVIVTTVGPHVATTRSFASAFQVKEWWNIFRKGLGQFILAYVIIMVVSWVLMFAMQLVILTIILLCIVPFIMIPYTAYNILVGNALYAQAYSEGVKKLEEE